MPTGMDMMVGALLKSAGVDPEKVKEDIADYARKLGDKISSMDNALSALRADQTMLMAAMRDVIEVVEQLGMECRRSAPVNGGTHGSRP